MKNKTGKAKYGLSALTVIVICIATLLVFLFLFLLAEEHGIFPGKQVSAVIADRKMKKYGAGFERTDAGFDGEKYIFTYGADGEEIKMAVDAFKITEDGYFEKYLEDKDAEARMNSVIEECLKENWPDNGAQLESFETGVKLSKEDVSDKDIGDRKTVAAMIKKSKMTVTVRGADIDFDKYKKTASEIAVSFGKAGIIPDSLQIFYMRDAKDGETEEVLQYESSFTSNQLQMDKSFVEASNSHRIVEVPEQLAKKYKAKSIIKTIYTAAIWLIIAVGVVTFLVKHEKKRRKYSY